MQELTGQQKLFVHEYLVDLCAKQAAIRAGYSAKTAEAMSHKLMQKPHIRAAIQKRMDKRSLKTDITAERVLQELAKIGFADIKDFLSYGTVKTEVDRSDDGQPIFGYKQIVDAKPSDEVDGTLINEVSVGKDGTFKFKMHDKKAALELLGKHLKLFTDKTEITGADGGPIEFRDVDRMSDDELIGAIENTTQAINDLQERISPKD